MLSYFFCILVCHFLFANANNEVIDCIEGETWYKLCAKCNCLGNGKYTCKQHLLSCILEKCIENVVIFNSKFRCHCAKDKSTVCVSLSYQGDLDGKECIGDTYYYDNCTYCVCDKYSKKVKCTSTGECSLSSGGVCNEGDSVMQKCHRCLCTYSKFRKCSLLENCWTGKEKPGNCYIIERFYPARLQHYCISLLTQQCYSDYGCPGEKKCCQIVDCYLRCVDPIF